MKVRAILTLNLFALAAGAAWFTPPSLAGNLKVDERTFATPTPLPQRPIRPVAGQTPSGNPNIRPMQSPRKLVLQPVRIPITKVAPRPPIYGKQSDRRLKGIRNELRGVTPPMPSALSIKEVKQVSDATTNTVKVLVANVGQGKNRPGEESRMLIGLEVEVPVSGDDYDGQPTEFDPLYFWVPGKPEAHPATPNWGQPFGYDELSQKTIDALPATTDVPQPFQKYVQIPPIDPGKSVWVTAEFILPDPGTTAIPKCFNYSSSDSQFCDPGRIFISEQWMDAAEVAKHACESLKFFYGSRLRLDIRMPFTKLYFSEQLDWYTGQLDSSFFMHDSEIPQGKYKGKCKG